MDWIHCNSCFLQPGEMKEKTYNLTSCGHMYCDTCLGEDNSDICKVCNTKYTTVMLSANMRPDVKEFFTGIDEMLAKMLRVVAFQNGHRLRLIAYNKAMGGKYKCAKEEIRRLNEIIKVFQKKLKDLEEEVEALKKKLSYHSHGRSTFVSPTMQQPQKTMPSPSPPFPEFSDTPPRKSHAHSSQNSWVTSGRLTLQRFSPNSEGSSPHSYVAKTPETENKAYVYRRVPSTPLNRKENPLSSYRNVPHFSSLSSTPETTSPSTPVTPDQQTRCLPKAPLSTKYNKGSSQFHTPSSSFGFLSLNSQNIRKRE